MNQRISILSFFLLFTIGLSAQWETSFVNEKGDQVYFEGDSMKVMQKLKQYRINQIDEGYINTSIDSIKVDSPYIKPSFYFGQRFNEVDVRMNKRTSTIVNQASRGQRAWRGLKLNKAEIADAMQDVISYLENNGYPFSRVQLDSILVDGDKVSSSLAIKKGPYIQFDSIDMDNKNLVDQGFLYRYLDIRPKSPYSHDKIIDLKEKIQNLAFIQLKQDPSITFLNNEAIIKLPIEKKRASRFDFIFGIVPSENSDNEQGYTLTGEFISEMINRLGRGERIFVSLRRLRPEVIDVKLNFDYPYIFGQPLGVETDFQLYRNSTDFLDVLGKVGLQFILSGKDQISISLTNKSSRLTNVDSTAILNSRRLPTKQDVTYTSGGLGLNLNHLDYRFNPTRGWSIQTEVNFGVKQIIKNRTIESFSNEFVDFNNAYDTLNLSTFQTEVQFYADYFLPPTAWSTIKFGVDAAFKYNQTQLYDNELWRIGGNRRLRGFEEETILTDTYIIATSEFRILLDKNSFLALPIVDYGWYKLSQTSSNKWDTAFSMGLGLNFATTAGVFNVSFVAGSRLDNPVNLQETKIHFGYVNLF